MINLIFFYLFFIIILFYIFLYRFEIPLLFKKPDGRGFHSIPISQLGGALIYISIFTFIIIVNFFNKLDFIYIKFFLIITPLLIITFLDDIKNLSILIRLVSQFIIISLLIYFVFEINIDNIWFYFYLLFLLVFLNFYNFMDGVNGYVSSNIITIIISYSLFFYIKDFYYNIFHIIILLPIIVFFIFNFCFNKVFLGDTGSILLSLLLFFYLYEMLKLNYLSFYEVIIILNLYLIDGFTNLIYRFINKENIFIAHRKHFYQIISEKFNHVFTNFFQLSYNLIIFLFICLIKLTGNHLFYYFIIFQIIITTILVFYFRVIYEKYQSI